MKDFSRVSVIGLITIGIIFSSLFCVISCRKTKPQLEIFLKTDKHSYSPKESVFIQLIITNKTNQIFKSTFSSTQRYDFVVKKERKEIWRWSEDKVFAMRLTEYTLNPQESVTYQERWIPQEDLEGRVLPQGEYEVIGILNTQPQTISPSVFIEITP